jgi:hypothetical protein
MEESAANPQVSENARIMKNVRGKTSLSTHASAGKRGVFHRRARLTTRKRGGYHSDR